MVTVVFFKKTSSTSTSERVSNLIDHPYIQPYTRNTHTGSNEECAHRRDGWRWLSVGRWGDCGRPGVVVLVAARRYYVWQARRYYVWQERAPW